MERLKQHAIEFTPASTKAAIESLCKLNESYWRHEEPKSEFFPASLPNILGPIIALLGKLSGSFIFVTCITPKPDSNDIWSTSLSNLAIDTLLNDTRGRDIMSLLQSWYSVDSGIREYVYLQPTSNTVGPPVFSSELEKLISTASECMLPELSEYRRLIEKYEAMDPPNNAGMGIFNTYLIDSVHFPPCLPRSPIPLEEILSWVISPLPREFLAPYSVERHMHSPEHLLIWLCCSPFTDPSTNLQLAGPGGISLPLFVVLRMLMTARYTVQRPSLVGPLVDLPHTILRIRTIATACVFIATVQLELAIDRLSGTGTIYERSGQTRFIPHPDCLPTQTGNMSKFRGPGVVVAGPKPTTTPSGNLSVTPSIQKIAMVTPWETFFGGFYEKLGKPLPTHLSRKGDNFAHPDQVEELTTRADDLSIRTRDPAQRTVKGPAYVKRLPSNSGTGHHPAKRSKVPISENAVTDEHQDCIVVSD